jgi:hypothetical protein
MGFGLCAPCAYSGSRGSGAVPEAFGHGVGLWVRSAGSEREIEGIIDHGRWAMGDGPERGIVGDVPRALDEPPGAFDHGVGGFCCGLRIEGYGCAPERCGRWAKEGGPALSGAHQRNLAESLRSMLHAFSCASAWIHDHSV